MNVIDMSGAAQIPYGPRYFYRIGEFVASKFEGALVREADTTSSVYVTLPNGNQLRISDHRQYGAQRPTHIRPATKKGLPALLDRAVRAALAGTICYAKVPSWSDLTF